MFSICIPSTSINKVKRNLNYINKKVLKSSIIKEIEICIHINGYDSNINEIFKDLNHDFKKQFSNSLSKTTFQESYISAVKLATQKFLIVIGDTDKIIYENIEKFLLLIKDQKNTKQSYIFDNTECSYKLSSEFLDQKLINLNIKNFEKLLMPLTPTFIGNVIFNNYFLKNKLSKYSDIKTELPHFLPYLCSLFDCESAYYTEPIVYPDDAPRVWSPLQDRFNSFDLIRVHVLALKTLSINNLSLSLFKIPIIAVKSLPKAILKELYFLIIFKNNPYPYVKQPFWGIIQAYISCFILFCGYTLNKLKKLF